MTSTAFARNDIALFAAGGERKYLCSDERQRFKEALDCLTDPFERTFAESIYWAGYRPCEALRMQVMNVDISGCRFIVRCAKKRGSKKGQSYRSIPIPAQFMTQLNQVHDIALCQRRGDMAELERLLWPFSRTTGWRIIRRVMDQAGVSGRKASARGLRHSYAVNAILHDVPLDRVQNWLGHEHLDTTAIYTAMAAQEDRLVAERMWAA